MKSNSALIIVKEYGKRKELHATKGRRLSEVLSANGIAVDSPCGGMGRCGKCRVRFISGAGDPTSLDLRFLSEKDIGEGVRLLCRAVVQGDCEIEICAQKDMLIEAAGTEDTQRSSREKYDGGKVAVAIDLGTTTIAAALIETSKDGADVTETAACVNRQRSFGADVISRIAAADDPLVLNEMSQLAAKDIEGLIEKMLYPVTDGEKKQKKIDYLTVVGNSSLMNLLMGRDVSWMGAYPYAPHSDELRCRQFETERLFTSLGDGLFTGFPGISAFVGADIVSGIYYLESAGMETDNSLFIDLGTNGEMAYFDGDRIKVTSTAAGPVFEAGGMSCGVASVPGAICHVMLSDNNGHISCSYETIDNRPPIGICGTGVLELVSEAVRVGIIDSTGLLAEEYFEEGLSVAGAFDIRFTQQDIRNVQLAKAAIFTGASRLLDGRTPDRVYIAGGFGSHIEARRLENLKMFPEGFDGKIIPVGNTSLKGAVSFSERALLGEKEQKKALDALAEIVKRATVIELATLDEFNTEYIEAMNF